ncbi:hypothetical protein CEP48_05070 [Mergibacter septicus]|uniref:Uncharacterized protein n=1 Tax=Mergibacter septicus TaxID=221402 RepID=A0A8D4IYA8_9PAST|nr:hypothetical protein [Mergibacter septicus]AWX15581.1 hypothetical protein CEP47_05070 [Mergibacter septicus]QDJ14835.1 hypothetical protein CEP48_05070 [Mergibacter septicus]UTU47737.1 hypothetical protein HLL31_02515 [Mergibacter septicus]WMR96657.1 hypothetical protein RDJ12_03620 [Mergibacter septicus]
MSKQKKTYYTRFEGDKKRVNIYQLSKKVELLSRQVDALIRANNKLFELNQTVNLSLDNLKERIDCLEARERVDDRKVKGSFLGWLFNKLK